MDYRFVGRSILLEKAEHGAFKISSEVIEKLGNRKVKDLSLEEALYLKELIDIGVMYTADSRHQGIKQLMYELNDHIYSLYQLEAAGDLVKELHSCYTLQDTLNKDIEEIHAILNETQRRINSERGAARSRGQLIVNGSPINLFIKSSVEANKKMLEDVEQKKEKKRTVDEKIPKLQLEIKEKTEAFIALHKRPSDNIRWQYKAIAWAIVKNAELAKETPVNNMTRIPPVDKRMRRMQNRMYTLEDKNWLESGGIQAIRWAQRIQGVVPPPPPPQLSPLPLSVYNTVEDKAVGLLNAKDSAIASQAIFPSETKINKPKWGIHYVGPGFGGGKTRKRKLLRKRRKSHKK